MTDWEEMPDEDLEEASEAEEEAHITEPLTFWQMVQGFFFQMPGKREQDLKQRLLQLSEAIDQYPDSAVNYLIRGEVREALGYYELARDDFKKALELAERTFEGARWGLSAQAIMDQAQRQLEDVHEKTE